MKKSERKSLYFYILIAYGITWLCWITAILLGYKDMSFLSIFDWNFINSKQMIAFIIFRIGVYGPLVASIIVTSYYLKANGLKSFWNRISKWKVDMKWYLYMFLLPIVLNLVVVLIGVILGVPLKSFFSSDIPLTLILGFFIYQILTSGLEEPGWRGFALEELQKKYTAEKASWILGLIWAVWHYPYVIFLYYSGGLVATMFSLAGFTMSIIGQTFIITWFYNNTRSVLIAILLHGMLNTATTFILGNITISNPTMGIIPALVTWGIVFALLKLYGGETLTKPNKTIGI